MTARESDAILAAGGTPMDRIARYLTLAAFLTACGAETSKYMTEAQQAYLDARRGDVTERIGRAYEVLGKLKPEDVEARTLRPEDGQ
jgi:hypothetical protein